MRVVAVLPRYPPLARVGAFLATHELLADLARRGHRVDVVTVKASKMFTLDGVSVGSVVPPAADVVVSHAGDDGSGQRFAESFGCPSVRMVHGWLEDLPARVEGADLVVFNSEASAADAGYEGRQVVVRPPLRTVRAVPGDRVTLVNLSWPKGGDLFWRLARCAPDTRFLGVKGGYGKQVIDRYPNVEVLDPTDDIAAVFARTRVLLMPSERESWGMVGVEALSCGIPVIAHPTGGLRESLGDAGIFVDRADGQGWLDELERLAVPGEWEAASMRALAHQTPDDRPLFAEVLEELVSVAA